MQKVLKWIGIVLGGLVGLIVLLIAGLLVYSTATYKRTVDRPVYEITADTSPEGVARGEYLVRAVVDCGGCHSPDGTNGPLSGYAQDFVEGPISMVFSSPNLTPDAETGLGDWTDAEIARAIREGLDKDGVELIMPSVIYHNLSDADTAAIVGYLRSLEPVRNEPPPLEMNAFTKVMVTLGQFFPRNPQAAITAPVTAPPPGVTVEYGAYLAAGCGDCHGENLAGGTGPGPAAPNITTGGELAGVTEEGFIKLVRTEADILPPGRTEEEMPWKALANMTDEDLRAVFAYIQSVPAAESGE